LIRDRLAGDLGCFEINRGRPPTRRPFATFYGAILRIRHARQSLTMGIDQTAAAALPYCAAATAATSASNIEQIEKCGLIGPRRATNQRCTGVNERRRHMRRQTIVRRPQGPLSPPSASAQAR
jgi:hypothetical protein